MCRLEILSGGIWILYGHYELNSFELKNVVDDLSWQGTEYRIL